MATLQYLREYRTYEQIAADFNIHESNLIRKSHWAEQALLQVGFYIQKQQIYADDVILIDASEIKVNRPKKPTAKLLTRKNTIQPRYKLSQQLKDLACK